MNEINYNLKQLEIIKALQEKGEKPKLLLHSCCAPCSSSCLERLVPYFMVDVFYYNPNITNSDEYYKRLNEQKRFCFEVYGESVNVIDGRYDISDYLTAISGKEEAKEGGERCKVCYTLRLEETAKTAKNNGYDYFTTTLSVSPHKNAKWLNEIGEKLSEIYGVNYLYADFKKGGGYLRSTQLSKQHNLFRQDYCGCDFSKNK